VDLPQISASEIQSLAAKAPPTHQDEIKQLYREWEFPSWYFSLREGFNLCVYGYGSKIRMLTTFVKKYCCDHIVLSINGYHPTITIREIKKQIAYACGLPLFKLDALKAFLREEKMYLLIHNIDGANLRTERCQALLAEIANIPNMFVICSVDHYYATLLWDQLLSQMFNFRFVDATNFDDYKVETSFETSAQIITGSGLSATGLHHVLISMTKNAREAFKLLAAWQCETTDPVDSKQGMGYKYFYDLCQKNFISSTDQQFRAQLAEYRDHKVIVGKRGPDGTEYLKIPLSKPLLLDVLQKM